MSNKILLFLIFYHFNVFSAARFNTEQKEFIELQNNLLNLIKSTSNQQCNPALKNLTENIKKELCQFEKQVVTYTQIVDTIFNNILSHYDQYPGLPEILSNEDNLKRFIKIIISQNSKNNFINQKVSKADASKTHSPQEVMENQMKDYLLESDELGFCKDLEDLLTFSIKSDRKTLRSNSSNDWWELKIMSFSHDERYIAIINYNKKKLIIYDLENAKIERILNRKCESVKFSPMRNQLAIRFINSQNHFCLEVLDLDNKKMQKISEEYIGDFVFSSDGKRIAYPVHPYSIKVFNLENEQQETFYFEKIHEYSCSTYDKPEYFKNIFKNQINFQKSTTGACLVCINLDTYIRSKVNFKYFKFFQLITVDNAPWYLYDQKILDKILDFDISRLLVGQSSSFQSNNHGKYIVFNDNDHDNLLAHKLENFFDFAMEHPICVKKFSDGIHHDHGFIFSPDDKFFAYNPEKYKGITKIVILKNYLKKLNLEQIKLLIELAKVKKSAKSPIVTLNKNDQRVFNSLPILIRAILKKNLKFNSLTNIAKRFINLKIIDPIIYGAIRNILKPCGANAK